MLGSFASEAGLEGDGILGYAELGLDEGNSRLLEIGVVTFRQRVIDTSAESLNPKRN